MFLFLRNLGETFISPRCVGRSTMGKFKKFVLASFAAAAAYGVYMFRYKGREDPVERFTEDVDTVTKSVQEGVEDLADEVEDVAEDVEEVAEEVEEVKEELVEEEE